MKLYVTYASRSKQANNFSVVEASSYAAGRVRIYNVCAEKYAFVYREDEFAGQIERYRLTEIPLQPQEKAE